MIVRELTERRLAFAIRTEWPSSNELVRPRLQK